MKRKRITVAGLCLVAVLALSGVAAASASAAQPTFKVCVKTSKVGTKYAAVYTEKACSEVNPTHEGKYELEEVATGTKITGKSKVATLTTKGVKGASQVVICKKDKVTGEVTGPSSVALTLTFEKCEGNKLKTDKCGNVGEETIETTLSGEFYYLDAAETTPGFLSSPPLTIFKCGGETVEVQGTLVSAIANTSKGVNIVSALAGTEQAHKSFFVEGGEVGPLFTGTELEGEIGVLHESTLASSEELKLSIGELALKGVSVR